MNKLDDIWPEVRAEIQSVRCREAGRRRRARWTARVAGLTLVGAAVAAWLVGWPPWAAHSSDVHAWQLHDVAATTGICADYPLARGERLFVVHGDGDHQHLAGVERHTGRLRWTSEPAIAQCRLAADERRVFLLATTPGGSWFCAAFDGRTGSVLWRQPVGGAGAAAPSTLALVKGGLCWTQGRQVVLRSPDTGALRWNVEMPSNHLLSAPVTHADVLYVASQAGLYALAADTGGIQWSQSLTARETLGLARPLLAAGGGRLVCAVPARTGDGRLWCIDPDTRQVRWTQTTAVPLKLTLQGQRVFVRSQALGAFDLRTGRPLWQAPIGGCGPVAFGDERVYLVDARERAQVLALDGRTGRRLWTRALAASCNGIVVRGPMGFLSGNDRTLYAFVLNERS